MAWHRLKQMIAAGLTAGALTTAGPASAQVFNPETFTLKNGMQVVVIPNHRVPVVSQMVWYKVGSADEVQGKTGLAHLTEHLMFKGTKEVPAGQFSRVVARNGGRDNAFTTFDYTGYYINVAKDRLDLAMKLEADRMANLNFDDKTEVTERAVVMEERRMRTDDDPTALLSEQMGAALWQVHPYHNPVIGWSDQIEQLTAADAMAWYRLWYAPNNAILVVSGDVTAAEVKPLAEKTFGKVAARAVPGHHRLGEPLSHAARRIEMTDARVRQPYLIREYTAPSYHLGEVQYAYALQVLAEALGGGHNSRLYKGLVVDKGAAATASAWYTATNVDLATFGVSGTPREGASAVELETAIDGVLGQVLKDGLTAEDVAQAKQRLRATVAYARDSLHTGANWLGQAIATGSTVDDVEAWPNRIDAVTLDQVNEAARKVLHLEASVTGILNPVPGAATGPTIDIPAGPPAQGTR